jgi:hypothetical protein
LLEFSLVLLDDETHFDLAESVRTEEIEDGKLTSEAVVFRRPGMVEVVR